MVDDAGVGRVRGSAELGGVPGGPLATGLVRKKNDLIDVSFIAFLSFSAVTGSFNLTAFDGFEPGK